MRRRAARPSTVFQLNQIAGKSKITAAARRKSNERECLLGVASIGVSTLSMIVITSIKALPSREDFNLNEANGASRAAWGHYGVSPVRNISESRANSHGSVTFGACAEAGYLKAVCIIWRPRRDLNPCYRRERWPINRCWSAFQHSEVHRNTSQRTQNTR